MRKLFLFLFLMSLGFIARAGIIYTGNVVNDPCVAKDTNYDQDLTITNANYLTYVSSHSQASPSVVTFVDGKKSTATITINSSIVETPTAFVRITVAGVVFDNNTNFQMVSTASGTAKALSDAMMANTTVNALIVSTWSAAGVVTSTSLTTGLNAYDLYTSTPFGFRLNSSSTASTATFLNGLASDVSSSGDTITETNHRYGTGLAVLLSTASGSSIGGLVGGTTYYAIASTTDLLKLSTTKANAIAGTAIDLGTQAGNGTFTLTPLTISSSPSYKWQASNDNLNFIDLAVSSVTISGAGVAGWDLGNVPYRYLRIKYVAPTNGCGTLKIDGAGRDY
jgi:hypothetical protein